MEKTRDRILITDDEENVRSLFKKLLEKEGYEVDCAPSGEDALEKLGQEWFDLVLTDLRMPGMSGLELMRRGKMLNPSLPFLILTAFGTVHSAVTAVKEGAYD